MTAWTSDELERVGTAAELQITPRHADGSRSGSVPIWVARVDDALYIRSFRGPAGRWYQAADAQRQAHISAGEVEKDVILADPGDVQDAVDDAYRSKYGRQSEYVQTMISEPARSTTRRLIPC